LLTCAHTAWKSTSASLLFCTSGQERVENLKISRGQLALYQEKRIKRQQTVSSARCKVLELNAGFLLAWMPSYCRFQPIECSYSESVSVSVPQDKIRGSAIHLLWSRKQYECPSNPGNFLFRCRNQEHCNSAAICGTPQRHQGADQEKGSPQGAPRYLYLSGLCLPRGSFGSAEAGPKDLGSTRDNRSCSRKEYLNGA